MVISIDPEIIIGIALGLKDAAARQAGQAVADELVCRAHIHTRERHENNREAGIQGVILKLAVAHGQVAVQIAGVSAAQQSALARIRLALAVKDAVLDDNLSRVSGGEVRLLDINDVLAARSDLVLQIKPRNRTMQDVIIIYGSGIIRRRPDGRPGRAAK